MIVLSFNIRGLGGRNKINKIKELVRNHKVDFLAIQETKMEDFTSSFCYNLWGSDDCQWVFRPSEGNSGGLLSIWRKSLANFHYSFVGESFVGVSLEWGERKHRCVLINVYAMCEVVAKKRLWERLVLARRNLGGGAWCILGDFNSVAGRVERRGVNVEASASQIRDMGFFLRFVREVDLEDQVVVGRRFTWYHPNGRSMSRIDRVLVSEEWRHYWGDCTLWVLPRDVSDHCPLVLNVEGWDWGPKPFRFNNFWLENRKCKEVVEEVWRSSNLTGWMGYVLKEKLKVLKGKLKEWHTEEYGGMEERVKALRDEIEELDVRGENGGLNDEEVLIRKSKFSSLWRLLKARDSLMIQRSRSRWIRVGDANTKYFHNCIKSRASRNGVRALLVDDVWVQSPTEVKRVVVDYFRNHVASVGGERPRLDGVPFASLSEMEVGGAF